MTLIRNLIIYTLLFPFILFYIFCGCSTASDKQLDHENNSRIIVIEKENFEEENEKKKKQK